MELNELMEAIKDATAGKNISVDIRIEYEKDRNNDQISFLIQVVAENQTSIYSNYKAKTWREALDVIELALDPEAKVEQLKARGRLV